MTNKEYKKKLEIFNQLNLELKQKIDSTNLESFSRIKKYMKGKSIHIDRNIVTAHLDFEKIASFIANDNEFYVVSGLNPSSDLHLGHKALFDFLLSLQKMGANIVIPITKELLKKDKIVIFDGCIYHKEVLDYLIKNLTFDSYIFTLKASLNTCIQRDKDRKRTIGEGVAEEVYNLVCNNNFGILIDTQGESIEETIDEIKNNLKSKNKYKST